MPLIFLLYALFASVFVIGKTSLLYSTPLFLVGTRMSIAGSAMLIFYLVTNRSLFFLNRKQFIAICKLAFFNIYLTNVFEFWGLKYLTSAKTCFIYGISPFLSALFSYFLLREKMTFNKWTGLLIGFLGLIPIILSGSVEESASGGFWIFSWAEAAVLGAATASVYGWVILRKLVRDEGLPLMLVNGMSMFIGGVLALIHSYAKETWDPFPVSEYLPFIQCTAMLLLISNLICYNLYGYLLRRFSATLLSFAGFTTSMFTALFGWFFLGETVSLSFYLSSVIVLFGLTLFYLEELRQETKVLA